MALTSEQIIVTFETTQGQRFTGTALMAELEISAGLGYRAGGLFGDYRQGPRTWDLRLSGVGEPFWLEDQRDPKSIPRQSRVRTGAEWECPWCGALHLMDRRQCSQCGGWRLPLYE